MLEPTGVAIIQWILFNLAKQPPWVTAKNADNLSINLTTKAYSPMGQANINHQLEFTVMGDICWRSGEVVLVVMEEEKRSVETFYDCVDLELEENTFSVDQVGAISDNHP